MKQIKTRPTLMDQARKRIVTRDMVRVAKAEGVEPEFIREGIANGNIVITRNRIREQVNPLGIGKGLRIKVNANLGTSKDKSSLKEELKKLRAAEKAGADTVMDLSTGEPITRVRRAIISGTRVPVGTVPIYQAVIAAVKKKRPFVYMSADDLFHMIRVHAQDGVDFVTVHCGVTRESVSRLNEEGRVLDVVSRGGAMTVEWMDFNRKENPLYEHFERLLDLAREFELVLSLGDGLRPGCLADATDRGQVEETILLGELTKRAWEKGVQVMIEGPGHVPMDQIQANVLLEKRLCHGAPFYVLGPLVTDIAPGYDHITGAIGGAIAALAGADFLCYVTPSEHLRLPDADDVREGVIASRIAAHAADICRGVNGAWDEDLKMARARKALDWQAQIRHSLDPDLAGKIRSSSLPEDDQVCTMCGEYCAIKLIKKT
jgi:phosphomethylpyrimidine synthase